MTLGSFILNFNYFTQGSGGPNLVKWDTVGLISTYISFCSDTYVDRWSVAEFGQAVQFIGIHIYHESQWPF